ncbi:putative DUF21 domain-containing protein At3g13070, chloroplastic isoform X2 [Telopea speciosissima]|uniref:putative DUF21 domain-containing protein At3g13070, chloroplastic isoform X2 n=1 Tax=Telopea speciosissima TaxID=54955 RepID=UPI001CC67F41|nr:putative DUF21 domain-containing protein At3g13070, chloroplastic isoform X2 [Telopea speciosissima]
MEAPFISRSRLFYGEKSSFFVSRCRQLKISVSTPPKFMCYRSRIRTNCPDPFISRISCTPRLQEAKVINGELYLKPADRENEGVMVGDSITDRNFDLLELLFKRGFVFGAMVCGIFVLGCQRVLAMEVVVDAGYRVFGQSGLLLRGAWPKVLKILCVFKEQGLVLAALLGLSAFFSLAETSITTLWPWKVAVLLLTEITPKSIAVHHATEVARFVVRPVAWLSLVLYPVGRVVTFLSMGMLKMLGLKGRSEPSVTEDELKLILRGAELSGAIEEEEQDMIENVLEIKDTHVREVMTPLVNVVAIDVSATLTDFHNLWVTHQYSRVPVFEQRVDNIVGIAYAMDLLDYVQKGELLESSFVEDIAHKPAYFVPDSMSVWNLLREFRIRKVHMAVVLNEYGGTVGIVTLEDVVEEIVGEIFDENDSKEEIQKKTGYVAMRGEGIFDVDANTSIDQLSEDLNVKMPEGQQYETVSGFICEAFGYIPRTGESIKVVLENANREENDEFNEPESDHHDQKEKYHIFKLEILAGNARKVSAVRFERVNQDNATLETKEVTRLVPRIMKRKWRDDEGLDKGDYIEIAFQER